MNKRTSRIGANLPLIKANLCPLSFVDVPKGVYVEGTLAVYETQRVELLRDVFVWAYERSSARYAVLRNTVPKPDPIRLKYREPLREIVREWIRARSRPDPVELRAWADAHAIPEADAPAFVNAVRAELLDFHEGLLVRYQLLESEFLAWKTMMESSAGDKPR